MTDATRMIAFLKERTDEAWANGGPYFLSNAGPDLTAADITYRDILNGEKMKDFIVRTAGEGGYQLIQHPVQRAKLGLVPAGETFTFEDRSEETGFAPQNVEVDGRRGAQLLAFLDSLSRLTREDQDEVVIPTRVLVKLARKK